MNPNLSQQAINKIEHLCGLGCSQVNQILVDVQNGKEISELSDFDAADKELIIAELKDIMSVY